MKHSEETTHLFWTGGLDSTFRLVQLLYTTTQIVQPHYLLRREESTGKEIDTMIKIRRALVKQSPEMKDRILPTVYTNEYLIPEAEDLKKEIVSLRESGKVAEQYEAMAYYCKALGVDSIEVALTNITGEKDSFEHFRQADAFRFFTYPTIELSKKDMYEVARKEKWEEILNMTTFCRRPRQKSKACGVCGPCVDAVMSGMGHRIPPGARLKANIQIPFRNYYRKNYAKHEKSRFFRWVKATFEGKF